MTTPDREIDLTNLPRFLKHLGHPDRDAPSAAFARKLLDDGGEIRSFSGPEQMDVWELVVRRGNHLVRFGVERGYSDGAVVRRLDDAPHAPRSVPMKRVVLEWARATRVDLAIEDTAALRPDLLAYGTAALDWLDAGNDDAVWGPAPEDTGP